MDLFNVPKTLSDEERAAALAIAGQILDWANEVIPAGQSSLLWRIRNNEPIIVSRPPHHANTVFRKAKLVIDATTVSYHGSISDFTTNTIAIFKDYIGRRIHYSRQEVTAHEVTFVTKSGGIRTATMSGYYSLPSAPDELLEVGASFLASLLEDLRNGSLRVIEGSF